jgi:hypothetical protein
MQIFSYEFINGHVIAKHDGELYLIDTGSPSSVAKETKFNFAEKNHLVQTDFMGVTVESLSSHIGVSINALVGADILNDFSMIIDSRTRELKLFYGELTLSGMEIPVELFMGIPVIDAAIDGRKIRLFFDTGAKLSYLNPEMTENSSSIGYAEDFYPGLGPFQTEIFSVSLQLATEEIELTVGNLPALLQGSLMVAGTDGILGTSILSSHVVGLDPGQQKFVLKRID